MSDTYRVWAGVIQRCTNTKSKGYKDYGGRGITVCARWRHSFENFLADMGERPEGLTLDRRDNNGPYSPENCRWVTHFVQMGNTRRNVWVTYLGETRYLSAWARYFGVPTTQLWDWRKKYGDIPALERAFSKALSRL